MQIDYHTHLGTVLLQTQRDSNHSKALSQVAHRVQTEENWGLCGQNSYSSG